MLPENEMINENAGGYTPLPEPRTVRLRFEKTGSLQFISHLDLQRSAARILTRAGIPLWYTRGFNPHPKLVFAMPLPIGCESVCELADVRIDRDMDCGRILDGLHRGSSGGLRFTECYIPERPFRDIAWARYEIRIAPGELMSPAGFAEKAAAVMAEKPLTVIKHGKSGDRLTDISGMMKDIKISCAGEETLIDLFMSATEGNTLSPAHLLGALTSRLGVPGPDTGYSAMRVCMTDSEGSFFR